MINVTFKNPSDFYDVVKSSEVLLNKNNNIIITTTLYGLQDVIDAYKRLNDPSLCIYKIRHTYETRENTKQWYGLHRTGTVRKEDIENMRYAIIKKLDNVSRRMLRRSYMDYIDRKIGHERYYIGLTDSSILSFKRVTIDELEDIVATTSSYEYD